MRCWAFVSIAIVAIVTAGGAERPAVRTFDCFTQGLFRPYGPHCSKTWHVDETPVEGYDGLFDDLGFVPTRQGL
jgi:hypothetical protein